MLRSFIQKRRQLFLVTKFYSRTTADVYWVGRGGQSSSNLEGDAVGQSVFVVFVNPQTFLHFF